MVGLLSIILFFKVRLIQFYSWSILLMVTIYYAYEAGRLRRLYIKW